MFGACPKCNSPRLRYSHPRTAWERLRAFTGIFAIRCRDCHYRFIPGFWHLGSWKYAHCPRCLRLDLTYWSETHYHVTLAQRLFIGLGAKRYRCEACRCNFTSFGRLKKKYRLHRRQRTVEAATHPTENGIPG